MEKEERRTAPRIKVNLSARWEGVLMAVSAPAPVQHLGGELRRVKRTTFDRAILVLCLAAVPHIRGRSARSAQRAAGAVAPAALDPDLLHQARAEHAAEHRLGDRERRGVGVAVARGEVADPQLGLGAVRLVDEDQSGGSKRPRRQRLPPRTRGG